jgi:hypothetical protein
MERPAGWSAFLLLSDSRINPSVARFKPPNLPRFSAWMSRTEVADHPRNGSPTQVFNSGGFSRLASNQQVDFHVALGLNRDAPDYSAGVGCSVRFDEFFSKSPGPTFR